MQAIPKGRASECGDAQITSSRESCTVSSIFYTDKVYAHKRNVR